MDGLDSELTFGYYDKSKYTGDMVWHPILHRLMFGIQLDDIKVNGKPMNRTHQTIAPCLLPHQRSYATVPLDTLSRHLVSGRPKRQTPHPKIAVSAHCMPM